MTNSHVELAGLKIGFIGAGNMAKAIIGGLLEKGVEAANIFASAKSEATRTDLAASLGVNCDSNNNVAAQCQVVILAVKPQILKSVCLEISASIKQDTLLISVAAGVQCSALASWLGEAAIVRCMPNTPSAIGEGVSGLYANERVSLDQRQVAQSIMQAVGIAEYVSEEHLIDVVTAISGSAPAYFFLFLEAMVESATNMGMNSDMAKQFAVQTAIGASKLAQSSDQSLETLRKMVTSPNGTTERAILSFESNQQRDLVDQAMKACVKRAKELSQEMSSKA